MLGKIEDRRRRGWHGWMASLMQWTWVRANSRRCWRTGKPGVLQFMGSHRVEHDWVTASSAWSCLLHLLHHPCSQVDASIPRSPSFIWFLGWVSHSCRWWWDPCWRQSWKHDPQLSSLSDMSGAWSGCQATQSTGSSTGTKISYLVWKRYHRVWEGTLNWGFSPLFCCCC